MNEHSWKARRAAARWLFVERRMEFVAEEVAIPVEQMEGEARKLTQSERAYYARLGMTEADVDQVNKLDAMTLASRSADALGLTRPRDGRARELRVVEVKVSRDDLLAGLRKQQISNGPGGLGSVADFCYLLVPKDVSLDLGELPPRWGVLIWNPDEPNSVQITKPGRRLTPTVEVDVERLARAITQSSLWRLYSYDTSLTYRRWREKDGRDLTVEMEAQ